MTVETTGGRHGFIHQTDMNGVSSQMKLKFILPNFKRQGLPEKGDLFRKVCYAVQASEPGAEIKCEIYPQYRSMRYWLEDDIKLVDKAHDAPRR